MKNKTIVHNFLNKWKNLLAVGFVLAAATAITITANAAPSSPPYTGTSIDNNPYVVWSPDYGAWTLEPGVFGSDTDHFSSGGDYSDQYEIYTGVEPHKVTAPEGYHVYAGRLVDIINIGKWRCSYSASFCIQGTRFDNFLWHGMRMSHDKCLIRHQNGWMGTCADCGREIYFIIYASDNAISTLKSIPANSVEQFYICPYTISYDSMGHPNGGHFEQAGPIAHMCDELSANQYRVKYDFNKPADAAESGGFMVNTTHSYDNNGTYEGVSRQYDTALRKNTYWCMGYEFTGWNTKADGSGIGYTDGQPVLNLTSVDNGIVTLYAQWKPCISTLNINPNGGLFDGNGSVQSFPDRYGNTFSATKSRLTPPTGVLISFVTNGGSSIAPIRNTMSFTSWQSGPLYGTLDGNNLYTYSLKSGITDTLTAQYTYDSIILPTTTWVNHSFGGWYFDPEFTRPAGNPGDKITVSSDTTLYAQWAELVLKSVDDYSVYDGAGAVDLSWYQKDGNGKVYKLYQSTNGTNWQQLYSASDIGTSNYIYKNFTKGAGQSYTVTSSGIYDLSLKGEPGGNYGYYHGGYGGQIDMRIYLKKGDVLSFDVGQGGGAKTYGGYSAGGGYTQLKINGQLIAVAGGGGGATPLANGGNGGMTANLVSGMTGQSGMVGGGGGYQGGASGELIYHTHTSQPYYEGSTGQTVGCYTFSEPKVFGAVISRQTCEHHGHWCDHPGRPHECDQGCTTENGLIGATTTCSLCGATIIHGSVKTIYKCESCGIELGEDENATHEHPGEWFQSCGKTTSTIESSYPAYGGSNYLGADSRIVTSSQYVGTVSGACGFELKSVSIGFQDDLYLNDVMAYDRARPDKIDKSSMMSEPTGDSARITWKEPASNGTTYYHKALSFLMGSDTMSCESNITENTLTARITGYYYRVDTNQTGELAASDLYQTGRTLSVKVLDYDQWLHVAARDAAGNIGPAVHVKITKKPDPSTGDIPVRWNLHTEQITIKGNSGNVYHAYDKTYYVKADGETPFTLAGNGVLNGKPYAGYGINGYGFVSDSGSKQGGSYLTVTGTSDGLVSGIGQWSDAGIALDPYIGYSAKYSGGMTVLSGNSNFTMADGYDGRTILVWPRAYAEYTEELHTKTKWSDANTDMNNGLILIGDARPPIIHGLDILQSKDVIDRGEETVVLDIWCEDSGSGVGGFTVTISNSDTGETKTYEHSGDGHLTIDITDDETVFVGDFTVTVEAHDNVGNESQMSSNTIEFELDAYITRILDPHDPLFREGESGILHVKTLGFADRIEVSFPNGLDGYTQVIDYQNNREYEKNDEIQFMIPLYYLRDYYDNVDHKDNIPLTVKAYKGDTVLTAYPKMSVFDINGTVLTEFRDRLK